jgi:lambda repressor-like predicted transcriptional regulator
VIDIESNLGSLEAERRFDHYESVEIGNRVIHTVERAAITGHLDLVKGSNLFLANEALKGEVEDICAVLALCYRQPVNYYEIEYISDPREKKGKWLHEAVMRRRHSGIVGKIEGDELINYRDLIDGGLDRLLKSYRGLEHRDALSHAMRFLSSSYRMGTLESSYFLCYSALDAVCAASDGSGGFLLPSGEWKKVEKLLGHHLTRLAVSEGFERVLSQMKRKLPELRRTPSVDRIRHICETLGVETRDIWPDGFESGIKKATKMRNDLFHSALLVQPQELERNLVRLRVLTERVILKVLNWPDDKIWRWYDQDLNWINKSRI